MRRWLLVSILMMTSLFLVVNQAQARWWIFGRAENIPEISTVFIGGVDITGIDKELVLDQSNFEAGNVIVKGFATKADAPLAIAKISLDEGQTWVDVDIVNDIFIHPFSPEKDKEYKPRFKVMDTAGKESDIKDLPQIIVVFKDVSATDQVQEALLALIDAYSNKNLPRFLDYVSDSFRGDAFALEEAIRTDFNHYDNIHMDTYILKVNKSGSEALVDFEFYWKAIKRSDGTFISPSKGRTSYTFAQEGDKYKLLSMETPIIFGISHASEITSGSGSEIDPTSTAFGGEDTFSSLTIYTASFTDGQYIDFSTQTVAGTGDLEFYSFAADHCQLSAASDVYIIYVPGSFSSTTSTSLEPNETGSSWAGSNYVYLVKDACGKYSLFEITSLNATQVNIQYKYQPNGTKNFP